ncbi:MAG: diaminopimelate epimerase [Prevotellaceae bacterium]|nr:diaminopimelate epimerase [Prevotellaceae bacterium]
MSKIKFTKMHGAGNDYIYVDAMQYPLAHPEKLAVEWSAPHTGIGSDGLILIDRSEVADFKMRMFNNDGSEGIMCGNGVRCVGKFVYDKGLTSSKSVTVETLGGIKVLQLTTDNNNKVTKVRVDMGRPSLHNKEQLANDSGSMTEGLVQADGRDYIGTFVCMGNPHFVIFVDDIEAIDLTTEGRALETHSIFSQRCNIEFAEVRDSGVIRTRVWERGTGITLACGTGACATAVAAIVTGKAIGRATIAMDGGDLEIEWDGSENLYMTGPAATVFDGEIEDSNTI